LSWYPTFRTGDEKNTFNCDVATLRNEESKTAETARNGRRKSVGANDASLIKIVTI